MKNGNDDRKPIVDDDEIHCSERCPFLEHYKHPYYRYAAFCHKLMLDLTYYDGYQLARCQIEDVATKGEI